MSRLLDTTAALAQLPKQRTMLDSQDFTAVILVGFGENLYPFNEGSNIVSKALLPIGNVPVINLVLDSVLEAGITDILIIAPPIFHSALSNHLDENYSDDTHPRARISLKKFTDGEKDGEEGESSAGREGTARLLKRFRHLIKTDFVLLPCDVSLPPGFTLSSVLDKHRSTPDAVLTAVVYEPVDAVRDSEEKVLIGIDRETDDLLLVTPMEGLEDELDVRMELLYAHPRLYLSARLLDAHIYVCRRTILDLMATRRPKDLDSIKEQVIPWLLKGSWQKGLNRRWSNILCSRDPLAAALARSTTGPPVRLLDDDNEPSSPDTTTPSRTRPSSPADSEAGSPWRCQVMVAQAQENLVRANSLAGYWEMNRRVLRNVKPRGASDSIAQSAQISPESLLGEGVRVGERASIKKSIVGRHCNIGRGAKLTNCILWDFVTVEENARIENTILCSNVRVGEKGQLKDCELGTGFEVRPSAVIKGERLVAGQEAI